ncbi:MAG: SAF domain-containing protein [Propionicimonas sp.]
MQATRHLDNLRRAFRWHRRFFAALLTGVAVMASLSVVVSRGESTTPVVMAARTITGGAVLTDADLEVVRVPPAALAEGAFTEESALVGQTVVAEVPTRRVLTASDLLGGTGQVPDGRVALPVRFQETGALRLLRVGATIDILGASGAEAGYGVVAAGVRVMTIPQAEAGGLVGSGETGLVLVEVTPAQAGAISAAAAVSGLNFALR